MENTRMPILQMKGITKSFPGVLALNDVSLSVNPGSVLALMGENGAGKSTLMKVLSGVYKRDKGEIYFEEKLADIRDPLSSQLMGISIIYQELNLLLNMDIAENIFIGREQRKGGFVDKHTMHAQAKKLLDEVGLNIDTHTLVKKLSTAQRQMIEVARALSFNAKLIIMDEPTSSLTETETLKLFEIIKSLREKNVAVVFISHRMKEIFEISDEIAIMRDGEMVGHLITKETDENEVIGYMVGREVKNIFAKEEVEIGDTILEVKNLSTASFLKDINFKVRKGEILGFAGLVGAGRSEVMRAVFGIDKRASGDIYIEGVQVAINTTVDACKLGIGLVPEDRKEQGLVLAMTVRENTSLAALKSVAKSWIIDRKDENKLAHEYIEALNVKTPSEEQKVINLSGGNQQKVVIAKWMATKPKILILDEPTRGIDVGAKKEIHLLMSKLAKSGVAIIMISSELPEIIGMSDRIMVMHEGEIKGELASSEASQEAIMKMAISKK